jgi:transporter family protein
LNLFTACFIKEEIAMHWVAYALLSAFFAALTSILAKIGVENVSSTLATAIRTVVVFFMAWGIVFAIGKQHEITAVTLKSWVFLVLSGCATGLSWLFYYKALQLGEVSKVVPIDKFSVVISMILAFFILGEAVSAKTIAGGILIGLGTLILAF